jgi:hypothetical protein
MFLAASFEPLRNILRPRPQVTLPPLSRLRLLPLLNSRPLDLINVRHRSYRHERRLALHEAALRNRASSALQWPRGRWCVLPLSSPHGQAPLPAALDHRRAQQRVLYREGRHREFGRRSPDVRFKATAVIGCFSSEAAQSRMTRCRSRAGEPASPRSAKA